MYLWQLEGHSNTPAERDNQEWVVEHRTHEQSLGLFFLQEVGTLPDVLHHVGDEPRSLCEVQGLAMVFSVLDTRLDMREAVHRFQEASLLRQLVSLFETMFVTPPRVMIHPFCCVSWIAPKSFYRPRCL